MTIANVFACGDVKLVKDAIIIVKHRNNGEPFQHLAQVTIDAGKNFNNGELMATFTLPGSVKEFITAEMYSSAENKGGIKVSFGKFFGETNYYEDKEQGYDTK